MNFVFGDADPDLSAVRFVGMDVAKGGSHVTLKSAVRYAPASPPASVVKDSATAISIQLQCLALSLAMQSDYSTVLCEREKVNSRVRRTVGPSIDLVIRCGFLRINHIVPYTTDYSLAAL